MTGRRRRIIRDQSRSNNHLCNRVFTGLSAEEYARVEPDLEPVSLTFGEIINRHHEVEQRLSRWLLMTRDRVASNTMRLTQEFLSWMPGVRNQAVSRAAMRLQNQGAIKYSRGALTIVDRNELERSACECYRMMKVRTSTHLY